MDGVLTVGFPMSCLIPMFTHECNLIRAVEILAKLLYYRSITAFCSQHLLYFYSVRAFGNFSLNVLYEGFFSF